jgi:predicted ribosome quality control (RQC) complex YloA/Tae2 family protein
MITTHLFVEETNKQYTVLVGKNKNENDLLIKNSNPCDLWFHLQGVSSPHIILQTEGDIIPKKYINQIVQMFPLHKSGLSSRFNVIYTEIKNVKLTNIPGTVIPSKIKIIKS